jgi:hypothetical protein
MSATVLQSASSPLTASSPGVRRETDKRGDRCPDPLRLAIVRLEFGWGTRRGGFRRLGFVPRLSGVRWFRGLDCRWLAGTPRLQRRIGEYGR